MPSFDIKTLLNFRPANYQCVKCRALLQTDLLGAEGPLECPVCKVRYESTDKMSTWEVWRYLEINGGYIPLKNTTEHGRTLATVATRIQQPNKEWFPPLLGFFEALNSAKYFVHFTTYGISHLLVGALKLASLRVAVRGIVSNADDSMRTELTGHRRETPQFEVKTFSNQEANSNTPHQKLIVVDGLLAFKGSVNLTLQGWRKVGKELDILDIETDVDKVITLHNRYFSTLWGQFSDIGSDIQMTDDLPF
jgi:hypothetical protein